MELIKGETSMSKTNESVEQKRTEHIREMKEQLRDHLREHLGESEPSFWSKFKSPEEEEKFLEQMIFMEGVNEQPLFDLIESGGVRLPEPTVLDDAQLQAKLWEVINGMAVLGCYLSSTDHLSDRELYVELWTRILREPASVSPNDSNAAYFIDILGGCSEEDLQLRLKYYADEDERLDWEEQYPEDIIPPHEPLPFDRDRYLPAPSWGNSEPRDIC
jgi:hypothetical protein